MVDRSTSAIGSHDGASPTDALWAENSLRFCSLAAIALAPSRRPIHPLDPSNRRLEQCLCILPGRRPGFIISARLTKPERTSARRHRPDPWAVG